MDQPIRALTAKGRPRHRGISAGDKRITHGMYGHPLYKTWDGMIGRTSRPADVEYHNYGGRGITVCERWRDPQLFIADIERLLGPRPVGWTLDRIDNDGNYEPGNVRWASRKQQRENQRPNDYQGQREAFLRRWQEREPRTEVCEQCGAEYQTLAVAGTDYQRFCSKKCKAKHRRDSGVDNVDRTCHQCGSVFSVNKYESKSHCTQSCAATCQHAGGCHPR